MNVLTLGTFDLFHVGHVNLLARCRGLAGDGRVSVGLNSDRFIEAYKGHRPTLTYTERAAVLRACRYVDEVIPNAQPGGSARPCIQVAGPDVIVVGDDWQDRDYLGQIGVTEAWLVEHGIEIVYLPYTPGISTTQIRQRS